MQAVTQTATKYKYAGYPLSVCYLNTRGFVWLNFDGIRPVYADDNIKDVLFEIQIPDGTHVLYSTENRIFEHLANNNGDLITTNTGEIIWIRGGNLPGYVLAFNIIPQCTPRNPFYVRWLNQLGGWEYFMFSFRQTLEKNVENQLLFYPFVRSQETAKGYSRTAWMEGREYITVGAAMLSPIEFEVLSRIVYSPQIEWYNEDSGKWFTLTIDNSSISKDTGDVTVSVEITFNLPAPQLQF